MTRRNSPPILLVFLQIVDVCGQSKLNSDLMMLYYTYLLYSGQGAGRRNYSQRWFELQSSKDHGSKYRSSADGKIMFSSAWCHENSASLSSDSGDTQALLRQSTWKPGSTLTWN